MQPSKCHKVFAWSPFGNQLVWFRETFLQNQVTSSKILGAIMENGPNLEGCDEAYGQAIVEVGAGDIHNPLISCPWRMLNFGGGIRSVTCIFLFLAFYTV